MPKPKLLVIGLDCATPQFLFDNPAVPLPNISGLIDRGAHGVLQSCDPPITVPAWSCMTTGADPGVLGCYGFRNRLDRSYAPMRVSTARDVRLPRVWDILGDRGHQSIVLGVPQTFPPKPVHGHLVTGLLTPDTNVHFTHPPSLASELQDTCGGYIIDVPEFRTDDLERVIGELNRLLNNRFQIAEHLITTKPWDFFMMVEIGLDRLHHALWRYADPAHPGHVVNHPFGDAFHDYYRSLDTAIGRLLDHVPNDTGILLVSDHGAKPIFGAIRINQWLIDNDYLALKHAPKPGPLDWNDIDWSRTRAFSSGGYYARIFLNVKGREPEGIVPAEDVPELTKRLASEIEQIPLPQSHVQNVVLKPSDIYAECNGVPPDLLVYFGNLHYRAVGTVGVDSIYADANDTGPDDANHAKEGVFVFADPEAKHAVPRDASIYDVAPTVLDWFDLAPAAWMRGRSLINRP